MSWTDEQIDTLYTDYIVGPFSARQTGLKIGKNRNEVIGKGYRKFGGVQEYRKPIHPVPDFRQPPTDFPNQCAASDCRLTRQPGRNLCGKHISERCVLRQEES